MIDSKSFFEKPDNSPYAGEADLSLIDNDIIQQALKFKVEGTWFYFNRLIVPVKLRGQGLSKKLLQQVIDWADANKVNIYNDINPYGALDLNNLYNFILSMDSRK
jgi:predicted GNAT family acetyltransferase